MTQDLTVEFLGETYTPDAAGPFTIGRDADLVVDADNPFLHRHFLTLTANQDLWWLTNVGTQLTATVADEAGATVILHHLTAGLEEISARQAGRPQSGAARARRVSRAGNEHLASIMEPVGPDERIRVIRH